ncbi:MAG: NAD(P)-binding domain-containing protein [Saccharothrix sp.]|nr:NAD(P)-binding domain-containing protein [Saccharothrix sp.]
MAVRAWSETLAGLAAELGARAAEPVEVARVADVVVAAIPLRAFDSLPADALAGKTVVDTANYYPERDGHLTPLDAGDLTSSELVQRHLTRSQVVKAFNTITPHQIGTLARPAGAPDRSALPLAGDDEGAKDQVTKLLDLLGFDVVDAGPLAGSWRCEPGTPAYIRPYLGEVPPMQVEDFLRWTTTTSGVVVPAERVAVLLGAAVRRDAGEVRLPSA